MYNNSSNQAGKKKLPIAMFIVVSLLLLIIINTDKTINKKTVQQKEDIALVFARPIGAMLNSLEMDIKVEFLSINDGCPIHSNVGLQNNSIKSIQNAKWVIGLFPKSSLLIEKSKKHFGLKYINLLCANGRNDLKLNDHFWVSPMATKRVMVFLYNALRKDIPPTVLNTSQEKGKNFTKQQNAVNKAINTLNEIDKKIRGQLKNCNNPVFDIDGAIVQFADDYDINYKGQILHKDGKINYKIIEEIRKTHNNICILADSSHYKNIDNTTLSWLRHINDDKIEIKLIDIDGRSIKIEDGLQGYVLFTNNLLQNIEQCICREDKAEQATITQAPKR
ncbi:MAG: hypothetical protein JJW01_00710 [Alphaproteobacteria bacterium]|nr:hypothetical protein [Rickettsiales bacterium]